jgi:hypothetical protein
MGGWVVIGDEIWRKNTPPTPLNRGENWEGKVLLYGLTDEEIRIVEGSEKEKRETHLCPIQKK